MIILPFILMALSLVIFFLARRQKETIWLVGIFVGFILINAGVMLYYAKMGGLSTDEQRLFFILPAFQQWLQNYIITLDNLAFITSLGQNIFLYFLLIFSFEITGLTRQKWVFAAAAVWPLANTLLCRADFILRQSREVQLLISGSYQVCAWFYLAICLFCMLWEYFSHTIRWVKKQLRYILISVVNLIVYYLVFCQINPLLIISQSYFPGPSFMLPLQYRLRLSLPLWVFTVLAMVGIMAAGCVALYKYTKVTLDENKENLSMQRQIDTASMGAQVFIHGIKNQLLAERIVLERLAEGLAADEPDIAALRETTQSAEGINRQVLGHIDSLYASFKQKSLVLKPCLASELVQPVVARYQKACPDIAFELVCEADAHFLADAVYLAEAIENLINNAIDAVRTRWEGEGGKITVTLKADPRWCAIRIDDNGPGMDKEKLAKIFKPFYTDKNTRNSWGIGLSTVRQTVKSHFGQVYVESKPSKGSFFVIALPRLYDNKKQRGFFKTPV